MSRAALATFSARPTSVWISTYAVTLIGEPPGRRPDSERNAHGHRLSRVREWTPLLDSPSSADVVNTPRDQGRACTGASAQASTGASAGASSEFATTEYLGRCDPAFLRSCDLKDCA